MESCTYNSANISFLGSEAKEGPAFIESKNYIKISNVFILFLFCKLEDKRVAKKKSCRYVNCRVSSSGFLMDATSAESCSVHFQECAAN